MPGIKYVCLSDMHLGAENSLLTNLKVASTVPDPSEASPVLKQLVKCLKPLISASGISPEKPTLILNGDILELALADDNQAAMVFERFLELIMPEGDELFERIIYMPGNHDHHLWEGARETQYINFISTSDKFNPPGPDKFLPVPWHTTNMFVEQDPNPVPLYFLTKLSQRYSHLKAKNFTITAAYPNFGLFANTGQRCVVFNHGHYIEPLYLAMSRLRTMIFPDRKMPENVWDVETENFAWIDYFWSTMGRSGEVGQDIELIYDKLQDKEQLKKLLGNLADSLAKKFDLPGWGDKMESAMLKFLAGLAVDKLAGTERNQTERFLTEDAEKGLWWYVNGPLKNQIMAERKGTMPSDVTFVFGHTHKPFQEDMNFKGYPAWVNVYNSGGWVVDTVEPQSLHGGAVILLDDKLNTVSLQVYTEQADPGKYAVSLAEAMHPGQEHNALYNLLSPHVIPNDPLWAELSSAISRGVSIRAQNLRARINEKC